jgi:hypothetical protein
MQVYWHAMFCALLVSGCGNVPANGENELAATVMPAPAVPIAPSGEPPVALVVSDDDGRITSIERGLSDEDRETLVNVLRELGRNVIAKGRLDGKDITAVRARSPCVTLFTTSAGDTAIAWTEVGNLAGRLAGDEEYLDLRTNGAIHRLSTASGRDADLVTMGTGMLAATCDGED